jgi:peptide/nickel transport system substrate-binding protein
MNRKRMLAYFAIILIIGFFPGEKARSATESKVRIAVDQELSTVDQSAMYLTADYVIGQNYAEKLISLDPSGRIIPELASSWKVSPDGKKIEFTLRKGVKFHSGDPLTTKDVVFSFSRGLEKSRTLKVVLRFMDRIEALDDYHFTLYFKEPDVTFIPNCSGPLIVSKTYYDRVGEEEFATHPVGTGPYKFLRYKSGEYLDIERFDGYWGKKPSVESARFFFIPEEATRIAKLNAGEVDLISLVPYPAVADVEKSAKLKVVKLATNTPTPSVIFANQNPSVPWYDRRVRLAMAYAIDSDTIVKKVLYGIPNHWAFLAPYELGYNSQLQPYRYDPKKARELLAEAGYPNGFDLKFYWMVTGLIPMSREVAEAIASYWQAVGIRTELYGEELMAALSRRAAAKKPGSVFVAYHPGGRSGGPDPTYFLDLYFGCDARFSAYCNPEFDKTVAEARATVNDAKRAEIIRKAINMIQEDVATIPIFNTVIVFGMKKNLSFNPTQRTIHPFLYVKDMSWR